MHSLLDTAILKFLKICEFFCVCSLAISFLYLELEIVDVKELVQTSAMIEVTDVELYLFQLPT